MTDLSGKRCLLDTNLLVAFINRNHIHHSVAKIIYEKIINGEFRAVISVQNLLELSAVLVHGFGKSRKEVASDISKLASDSLLEVVYPDFRALIEFFSLMKKETILHVTDLFLLATAFVYNIEVIITGDKAFRKIELKEIEIFNPF